MEIQELIDIDLDQFPSYSHLYKYALKNTNSQRDFNIAMRILREKYIYRIPIRGWREERNEITKF
jgi:hypothetical protein